MLKLEGKLLFRSALHQNLSDLNVLYIDEVASTVP